MALKRAAWKAATLVTLEHVSIVLKELRFTIGIT
jgi:hypothetical protein